MDIGLVWVLWQSSVGCCEFVLWVYYFWCVACLQLVFKMYVKFIEMFMEGFIFNMLLRGMVCS